MIELRIQEAAKRKGIINAYQLQKAMNIQPTTAARWWRGNMGMISLKTIESLCDVLECEPSELIVRAKTKGKRRAERSD